LIRILERAGEVTEGQLTRSSVQRLLLVLTAARIRVNLLVSAWRQRSG